MLVTSIFSFTHNVFDSHLFEGHKNSELCGKEFQLFTTQSRLLTTPRKKPAKIIVGKEENAGNQHFLLFPQCFLPFQKHTS